MTCLGVWQGVLSLGPSLGEHPCRMSLLVTFSVTLSETLRLWPMLQVEIITIPSIKSARLPLGKSLLQGHLLSDGMSQGSIASSYPSVIHNSKGNVLKKQLASSAFKAKGRPSAFMEQPSLPQ